MADPEQRAASDPMAGAKEESYDKFFTESPDPWKAISEIDYGSDRSLASTVEMQVMMADAGQRIGIEKKLLKSLSASSAHPAATMTICKLLICVGSEASADPLAPLLKNAETADAARVALEGIPGEAVSKVLRDALGQLTGDKLAGLIGSVVARRDGQAVPIFQKLAADTSQPPIVQVAVKRALEALNA